MAARPAHGAALEHDNLARVGVTLVNLRRVRFAHGADTRAKGFRHTRASILALVNVRGGGWGRAGRGEAGTQRWMYTRTYAPEQRSLPIRPVHRATLGAANHLDRMHPARTTPSHSGMNCGTRDSRKDRHLGVLGVLCLGSADGDFGGESVLYLGLSFAAGRREGRPRSLTTRGSTVSRAGWSFGSTTRPPGSPAIFHHTRHTPRHMTVPHTIIAPDNCIKGPENCA